MTTIPLLWRAPPSVESNLPPGIKRTYIPTPTGSLELLIAQPVVLVGQPRKKKVLLFQHGGFGSASVWIPFLQFFAEKTGFSCYAASLRGHGASWNPGYLRMVFGTGKASMAEDLGYVVQFVRRFEAEQRDEDGQGHGPDGYREVDEMDVVLVGHSAGGGLAQYYLSRGLGRVSALVLMAAFPNFGGLGVYWNWFKLDPFFSLRMFFRDFGHTRSPLSSLTLIHRAFFSPEFPREGVKAFEPYMAAYESILWPLGLMLPFVNIGKVVRNVLGWTRKAEPESEWKSETDTETHAAAPRMLVMAGSKDTLMGVVLMRRMTEMYRKAIARLGVVESEHAANAVRFEVIEGSGHHIQNDLQWEEAASRIRDFVEKL